MQYPAPCCNRNATESSPIHCDVNEAKQAAVGGCTDKIVMYLQKYKLTYIGFAAAFLTFEVRENG